METAHLQLLVFHVVHSLNPTMLPLLFGRIATLDFVKQKKLGFMNVTCSVDISTLGGAKAPDVDDMNRSALSPSCVTF